MGKDKLRKFAENETFACLVQPSVDEVLNVSQEKCHPLKGHWNEKMFGRTAPIILELGCGHGEYTLDLSRRNPANNYIGVDIKGARLWSGAREATREGLTNVAFLRTRIEFINSMFAEDEVSEIWVTFCDPQPKKPNKRLTSPAFLDRYRKFMKIGGIVHLKTDSALLHQYTLEVVREQHLDLIASTADLYAGDAPEMDAIPTGGYSLRDSAAFLANPALYEVQTHYEKLFLSQGIPITYMAFKL